MGSFPSQRYLPYVLHTVATVRNLIANPCRSHSMSGRPEPVIPQPTMRAHGGSWRPNFQESHGLGIGAPAAQPDSTGPATVLGRLGDGSGLQVPTSGACRLCVCHLGSSFYKRLLLCLLFSFLLWTSHRRSLGPRDLVCAAASRHLPRHPRSRVAAVQDPNGRQLSASSHNNRLGMFTSQSRPGN